MPEPTIITSSKRSRVFGSANTENSSYAYVTGIGPNYSLLGEFDTVVNLIGSHTTVLSLEGEHKVVYNLKGSV